MFAFVMLILYGILIGVIAICFLCAGCWRFRPNAGAHSLSTPNTDNSQSVPTTNNYPPTAPQILPTAPTNYNPDVVINMQPLDPVLPVQDLAAPEYLPPSYDEAIIQE